MREQSLLQPAQEEDQEEDEDEDVDLDLDQDVHGFNDPNVQQQLDLLDVIIQDLYQSRNPQAPPHS